MEAGAGWLGFRPSTGLVLASALERSSNENNQRGLLPSPVAGCPRLCCENLRWVLETPRLVLLYFRVLVRTRQAWRNPHQTF